MARVVAAPLTLIIIGVVLARLCVLNTKQLLADEGFHVPQTWQFFKSHYGITWTLPMFPTYHLAIGRIAAMTGGWNVNRVRIISCIGSMATVPAVFAAARAFHFTPAESAIKAAQTFFIPIVFPFFFLAYTDMWQMSALACMLLFLQRRQYKSSGVFALMAVLLRQTAIVWVAMAFCIVAYDTLSSFRYSSHREPYGDAFRRAWPLGATLVAFAAFVVWNHGIAVGARDRQPLALNPTNVYCLILCTTVALAPTLAAQWRTALPLWRSRSTWGTVIAGAVVYASTFKVSHPWNQSSLNFYIHNLWLSAIVAHSGLRLGLYVLLALGATSLVAMTSAAPRMRWVLAFAPLSVVVESLIEPRYYIPTIVMIQIVRPMAGRWVERALLVANMAASGIVFSGIASERWFL